MVAVMAFLFFRLMLTRERWCFRKETRPWVTLGKELSQSCSPDMVQPEEESIHWAYTQPFGVILLSPTNRILVATSLCC